VQRPWHNPIPIHSSSAWSRISSSAKAKSDGFAPFLSMAGRDTSMVTDVAIMMPGPGAYEQHLPQATLSKYNNVRGASQEMAGTSNDWIVF
jgi:hypothetical protein